MNKSQQLEILNENRNYYSDEEFKLLQNLIESPVYEEVYRELLVANRKGERPLKRAQDIKAKYDIGIELSQDEWDFMNGSNYQT